MFRLIFLTFKGKQRYDEHQVHVHESPNNMLAPLMILALLSTVGGWLAAPAFLPGGTDYFTKFLQPVFGGLEGGGTETETHSLELWLAGVAVAIALTGALFAYWLYLKRPGKADGLAHSLKPAYNSLVAQVLRGRTVCGGGRSAAALDFHQCALESYRRCRN